MHRHYQSDLFAIEKEIACDAHLCDTLRRVQEEADKLPYCAHKLTFFGLVVKQLKFLAWKIWLLQGISLAALCVVFFTMYTVSIDRWSSAVLSRFLCGCSAVIAACSLPMLRRATRYRMFELEQSTRHAIRGNLLSQLLFIAVGDLCSLTVLALTSLQIRRYELTIPVTILSLMVPFCTAAVSCLMLWTRADHTHFQSVGGALCFLSAWLAYKMIEKSRAFTPTAQWCLWTGYFLICLGILYHEYRRLFLHRRMETMLP